MTNTKIPFNLSGVPKTLLLPLIGRAMLTKDKTSPWQDERALQVVESLDFDFNELIKDADPTFHPMNWAIERAMYFDNEVRAHLAKHPNAVIVNLGAGLETAFYRVDNGQLTWVDLDVPDVIRLKQQLLPPPPRVHYIGKSIFDFSWMEEVKALGQNYFFFSGGVFVYFKPDEVKSIFTEMAKYFKAEVVTDAIIEEDLARANEMLNKFNIKDARLQWGFKLGQIESWAPNIGLVYQKVTIAQNKEKEDWHNFDGRVVKILLNL